MRRMTTVFVVASFVIGILAPAAYAGGGNPGGKGPPGQSCQEIVLEKEGTVPGHSASSPGSPFNEPGINSLNGGTGGQNYSEKSQYDVACFHVSRR